MGKHMYLRLAKDGMHKNRQMYFPYLLTCVIMVMMDYLIVYLASCKTLSMAKGGSSAQGMLGFGVAVVAIFAVFFLLYTHSFLLKQRKKEFGLYYILGLNKQNLLRICGWETLITAGISLAGGLFLGILLSKGAELCLVKLIHGEVILRYEISAFGVIKTVVLFAVIFVLQFIGASWQMMRMQAVNLLHSDKMGEKPPKGNALFAIGGAMLLGGAYYLAVTIEEPVRAIAIFFIAVLMVIVATYCLFIAGSVFACGRLKKKKGFYYKANHFVSVSSMSFRMNRNGAGLASICILSTMVLVTMSTTICMYIGSGESVKMQCPKQVSTSIRFGNIDFPIAKVEDEYRRQIEKVVKEKQVQVTNKADYLEGTVIAEEKSGYLNTAEVNFKKGIKTGNCYMVSWMSLEDYNNNYRKNEKLAVDEVLLEDPDNAYKGKTIQFNDGAVYKVKRVSTSGAENFYANAAGYPPLRIYGGQVPEGAMLIYHYDVDTTLTDSKSRELSNRILEEICNYPVWEKTAQELKEEDVSFDVRTQKEMRDSFLSEFGALLFLGSLLSLVFLVATVLIIYYKQIAEGYEDVKRFDIMKKVGMTEREIKKSINSQLLMVFFIPLVTAGLHLSFAFPLIEKIIMLMGICNRVLLAGTSAIGFAVFAGFYMIVYKMTANEYYRIVNGKV